MKKKILFLGLILFGLTTSVNANTVKTVGDIAYSFEEIPYGCSNLYGDLIVFDTSDSEKIIVSANFYHLDKLYFLNKDGSCTKLTDEELINYYNQNKVYYEADLEEGNIIQKIIKNQQEYSEEICENTR